MEVLHPDRKADDLFAGCMDAEDLEVLCIPHWWWRHLRCDRPSRRTNAAGVRRVFSEPDHIAIHLLAEIVYWYRPALSKSEPKRWGRKFPGEKWEPSMSYFRRELGLTADEVREVLRRLEEGYSFPCGPNGGQMGLITTEYLTGSEKGEVVRLWPNVAAVRYITEQPSARPRL